MFAHSNVTSEFVVSLHLKFESTNLNMLVRIQRKRHMRVAQNATNVIIETLYVHSLDIPSSMNTYLNNACTLSLNVQDSLASISRTSHAFTDSRGQPNINLKVADPPFVLPVLS